MPKMKTKSGAKKRFRFTATGMAIVSEPDTRIIKRNVFPYAR